MLTKVSFIGNAAATQRAETLIKQSVHALLLTGPESIGKSHIATQLGNEVLHEISPLTMRRVRQLQRICATVPAHPPRIVVLEHADTWSTEVANAMLKLLEEPRSGTICVLTATVAGNVLPTIRSRCVEIPFSRASEQEMERLYDQLKLSDDAKRTQQLVYANGRPGRLIEYQSSKTVQTRWEQAEELYVTLNGESLAKGFAIARTLGSPTKKRTTAHIRTELMTMLDLLEARAASDKNLSTSQKLRWLEGIAYARTLLQANVHPQRVLEWFTIELRKDEDA